nr:hypothetical protein PPFHPHBJ_00036 [Cydia pomonella granulovirus]WOZ30543.1 hypothetical protein AGHAAFNI_00129 [Cydia pomonella granulovirus]WOZ30676.1 hypothetical protein KFGOHAPD_00001 [Cydia pomonella granulovirus]WOZ44812.1 hypothetical protein HDNAPKKO_00038 [Cydia pomonella granulovirus]WOZ44948.1 hypothetical protein GGGKFHNK_00036 [Cydia pomonella granulovirus]
MIGLLKFIMRSMIEFIVTFVNEYGTFVSIFGGRELWRGRRFSLRRFRFFLR